MLFVAFEILVDKDGLIIERLVDDLYIFNGSSFEVKHIRELSGMNVESYVEFEELMNYRDESIAEYLESRVNNGGKGK